ncbi:three component ABC system middle component [Pseudomonas silesiensis]|uniref:three component ABC system middle component n=1 Tax=Pseudomonas silesiensis TaxID=1853130 RepID=UPI0034D70F0A
MEPTELYGEAQRSLDEVYLVQNPALGAILMWEFVKGFIRQSAGHLPELPLLFIVLPIVFNETLRAAMAGTNPSSGLRLFTAKFSKDQEVLLALQRQMLMLRFTSLSSVSIGIESGLLTLDVASASVGCTTKRYPPKTRLAIRELGKHADKLGGWCGSLTLQEVQAALRIGF